jgi:dTDP-4-dehydrorhamnose 3,5-epimerase
VKKLPTQLAGLVLLEPDVFTDARGFFIETYRQAVWAEQGITATFVQDNHSRSTRGTLRGLHFQITPGQPKLVRVATGRIWDVVVDVRRSSSTFGQHEAFELDDTRHRQLYIPVGFAHGFVVISDVADVTYKVGSYYDPSTEGGIAWDDPALEIDWPISDVTVSTRDRNNPILAEAVDRLPDW